MDKAGLLSLAERCERAAIGTRELDWLIADALGEIPQHSIRTIGFDYAWYRKPDEFALWKAADSEGRSVDLWQPVERSTSLDAATSLFPADCFYRSGHDGAGPDVTMFFCDAIASGPDGQPLRPVRALAVTEELARVVAALRALAAGDNR